MPVARSCPSCRAELDPEQRYCGRCGSDTTRPPGTAVGGAAEAALQLLRSEPPGLDSGTLVDRKYRLAERLGMGGMGEVWRAEHLLLKRDYALKLMLGPLALDPKFQKKFIAEARILTELEHPNIVRAHDVAVSEQGTLYLVMDLVRVLETPE